MPGNHPWGEVGWLCVGVYHLLYNTLKHICAKVKPCILWVKLKTKSRKEHIPTVLCHLFTAKSRLQVTVTTAGMVRWGSVLAATCVTGELDGNLRTIITSCCIWSLNISGLCGRKHCWVERRKEQKETEGITQLVRGKSGKESGIICTYRGNNAICVSTVWIQDNNISKPIHGA